MFVETLLEFANLTNRGKKREYDGFKASLSQAIIEENITEVAAELHESSYGLGEEGARLIASLIDQHPNITVVKLAWANLDDTAMALLLPALVNKNNLKLLDLSSNVFKGKSTYQGLAEVINNNPDLQSLSLNSVSMKEEAASILAQANLTPIKQLDLRHNKLAGNGLIELARALGSSQIDHLDLTNNELKEGSEATQALNNLLEDKRQLYIYCHLDSLKTKSLQNHYEGYIPSQLDAVCAKLLALENKAQDLGANVARWETRLIEIGSIVERFAAYEARLNEMQRSQQDMMASIARNPTIEALESRLAELNSYKQQIELIKITVKTVETRQSSVEEEQGQLITQVTRMRQTLGEHAEQIEELAESLELVKQVQTELQAIPAHIAAPQVVNQVIALSPLQEEYLTEYKHNLVAVYLGVMTIASGLVKSSAQGNLGLMSSICKNAAELMPIGGTAFKVLGFLLKKADEHKRREMVAKLSQIASDPIEISEIARVSGSHLARLLEVRKPQIKTDNITETLEHIEAISQESSGGVMSVVVNVGGQQLLSHAEEKVSSTKERSEYQEWGANDAGLLITRIVNNAISLPRSPAEKAEMLAKLVLAPELANQIFEQGLSHFARTHPVTVSQPSLELRYKKGKHQRVTRYVENIILEEDHLTTEVSPAELSNYQASAGGKLRSIFYTKEGSFNSFRNQLHVSIDNSLSTKEQLKGLLATERVSTVLTQALASPTVATGDIAKGS